MEKEREKNKTDKNLKSVAHTIEQQRVTFSNGWAVGKLKVKLDVQVGHTSPLVSHRQTFYSLFISLKPVLRMTLRTKSGVIVVNFHFSCL